MECNAGCPLPAASKLLVINIIIGRLVVPSMQGEMRPINAVLRLEGRKGRQRCLRALACGESEPAFSLRRYPEFVLRHG